MLPSVQSIEEMSSSTRSSTVKVITLCDLLGTGIN